MVNTGVQILEGSEEIKQKITVEYSFKTQTQSYKACNFTPSHCST